MIRDDARAPYWKEIFLSGFPRALTEKVKETLREKYQGTIPYDNLVGYDLINLDHHVRIQNIILMERI